MFVLVEFEDGMLYICHKKKLTSICGVNCVAKYENGARYPAIIIASDENRKVLVDLKKCRGDLDKESNKTASEEIHYEYLPPNIPELPAAPYFASSDTENCCSINDSQVAENNSIEEETAKDVCEWFSPNITSVNISNISEVSSLFDENEEFILLDISNRSVPNNKQILTNEQNVKETEKEDLIRHISKKTEYNQVEDKFEPYSDQSSKENAQYSLSIYKSNRNIIQDEFELYSDPCTQVNSESSLSIIENGSDLEPFQNSGSEYVPSDIEKSNGSDDESGNQHDITQIDNSITQCRTSLEQDRMLVSTSKSGAKKLFCMFCKKFQSKFARHLERVHKDEKDVKEFGILKPGCPQRKKFLDMIKKKSQFCFNTQSDINNGELIVTRRPQARLKRNGNDYKICKHCRGYFSKFNIRHHAKQCFAFCGRKTRNLNVMGRKCLASIHNEASVILKKEIFPVLRDDEVVRNIRFDRLIILYGNKMCCKYRLQHQYELIRSNLRILGRFLIAVKSINSKIKDMASLFDPEFYDDAIAAINLIGAFDNTTNQYKTPSVAYNLGSLLKKLVNLLITDCIKRKAYQEKQNAEDFLKLLIEDIGVSVNKTVLETQAQQKRRRKVELPSKNDITIFRNHLLKKSQAAKETLKETFSLNDWLTLAETTLILIQLFNRRRAGECERIYIGDYQTHIEIDVASADLSPNSKKMAKKYVRFEIRGKLNRTVPVLLSSQQKESIDLILKHRTQAGVPETNRFIFGLPGEEKGRFKYLRACNMMRKYSIECGANVPTNLRGTKLRKHVATHCIELELNENEVTDIANFMGHSEKIHISHYRQPIVHREILRMSKLLEKAQGMDDTDESDIEEDIEAAQTEELSLSHITPRKKRSTSPFGNVKRKKRWTTEEKQTAEAVFKDNIDNNNYPSLKSIQEIQKLYPALKNRSPVVIKTWLSNQMKKKQS